MTPIPEEKLALLREMIFARRKIEAIKEYRALTGLGLKEAKDAVDELEATLLKESPERFAPKGKGCGTAAVLCLVAVVGLYVVLRR